MKNSIPIRTFCLVLALAWTSQAGAQVKLEVSADEKAALDLVNQERSKAGKPPFQPNSKLFKAARDHARNMAAQKNMSHELDGKGLPGRVNDVNYQWFGLGENITKRPTPAEAVKSWMESKAGHRETMLSDSYDEAGISVARDSDGVPYWCLVVGSGRLALERPTLVVSGKVTPPDPLVKKSDPIVKKEEPKGKTGRLTIARGFPVKGELTAKSPLIEKIQKFHMVYDIVMKKGETIEVTLKGTFDTFLVINDERDKPIAYNDDDPRGGTTNSRLTFSALRDGTYYLIVSSYGQREIGTYTLEVK